jgi:hypothetical protein
MIFYFKVKVVNGALIKDASNAASGLVLSFRGHILGLASLILQCK